jgi:hypothetical protein
VVDEGTHAGHYRSANAAVRAVHDGTVPNAWLYVVLRWDGAWRDATDVRRLPGSALDVMQESRIKWCAREIIRPRAKGLSNEHILILASVQAAEMDKDGE